LLKDKANLRAYFYTIPFNPEHEAGKLMDSLPVSTFTFIWNFGLNQGYNQGGLWGLKPSLTSFWLLAQTIEVFLFFHNFV